MAGAAPDASAMGVFWGAPASPPRPTKDMQRSIRAAVLGLTEEESATATHRAFASPAVAMAATTALGYDPTVPPGLAAGPNNALAEATGAPNLRAVLKLVVAALRREMSKPLTAWDLRLADRFYPESVKREHQVRTFHGSRLDRAPPAPVT